ncbi:MAG TPA: glycosyltransferase, partial [Puia sp.]
ESNLLRQYEKKVADKAVILAMVEKDCEQYRQEFGAGRITLLPVFLPFGEVMSREGTGCFCLYHGNLSVAENEQAVSWLLKQVFNGVDLPLIISGKNPSPRLTRMVEQHPHACLIPNPSDEEIQDLITKAQVNILPSFNCTGIKMKLLNALFNGRYSVVNRDAVEGTGLESSCHIADCTEEMIDLVARLYARPFTRADIEDRKAQLAGRYNNEKNTRQLMELIWETP